MSANQTPNIPHLLITPDTENYSFDQLVDRVLYTGNLNIPTIPWDQLEYLAELRAIMEPFRPPRADSPQPTDNDRFYQWPKFKQWLQSNHIDCTHLDLIRYDTMGFGIMSNRKFVKNQKIVSIPRKIIFCVQNEQETVTLTRFIQTHPILKNMPNVALSFYLLHEATKKTSFWQPYFDMLPKRYETCLFFTSEDFTNLRTSPVLYEMIQMYRNICKQYAFLLKSISMCDASEFHPDFVSNFYFDTFCWAVSTVTTRQNLVPELGHVLIPFWDFCNHKQGLITTEFDPNAGLVNFYAMSNIMPNEQIFMHYGNRSYIDFFVHNGFIPDENSPNDTYPIWFGISTADSLSIKKTSLLNRFGFEGGRFIANLTLDHETNANIYLYLRVYTMTNAELDDMLRLNAHELDLKRQQFERITDDLKAFLRVRMAMVRKALKIPEHPCRNLIVRLIQYEINFMDNLLEMFS